MNVITYLILGVVVIKGLMMLYGLRNKLSFKLKGREQKCKSARSIDSAIKDVLDEPIGHYLSKDQFQALQRAKNKAQALKLRLQVQQLESLTESLGRDDVSISDQIKLANAIAITVDKTINMATSPKKQNQQNLKVVPAKPKQVKTGSNWAKAN